MRALAFALVVALLAGCSLPAPAPAATATPSAATSTPTASTPAVTPGFVEPSFDGERALAHVRAQVLRDDGSVRHRVPGTEGNEEAARIIERELSALGFDVARHAFTATYGCEEVAMRNVVAQRNGTSGRVVVFAAHFDTRPIAEKDPDPANRSRPIPGANDGGSGVGVLLELARVLPPANDTLRLAFFDGEDGGGYKGASCTDWILGSRAYASSLGPEDLATIRALVLVDMVGDPGLRLPWEKGSREGPGAPLLDRLWGIAHGLGHRQFVNATDLAITDDHAPFLDLGVPAVDVIHLTGDRSVFPATHHTQSDDLAHVSAASLAAVGRTLETWWRQDVAGVSS
ncbi:MAG TPA: M28 family peptidase [Candidatus Thermoplasmatota archaeon]|nr:M28 family peptidase [Candidatus Thermoplasmatota archaeon]